MLSYSFYMVLVILSLLSFARRLFPFAPVVRLALVFFVFFFLGGGAYFGASLQMPHDNECKERSLSSTQLGQIICNKMQSGHFYHSLQAIIDCLA